jgi:hypothetical protein
VPKTSLAVQAIAGHLVLRTKYQGFAFMIRIFIAACFLLAAPGAYAAECGSTANRAGCVGSEGAASYNKNTGAAHSTQFHNSNKVAPGTSAQGWRGNRATKAAEPGCAFVNGRRVCS